jgi:hypothetical protein
MFLNIDLRQLRPHPLNANIMPERLLAKLEAHIRAGGNYPALIVRALPQEAPEGAAATTDGRETDDEGAIIDREAPRQRGIAYQILDGHHRAIVLRRLGHSTARCELWADIDDDAARVLLLTLNRLRGEDDPAKRGGLLEGLSHTLPPDDLARLLPEDAARIERLMALCRPPPQPLDPPVTENLPQALTFFMSAASRREAVARLRAIDADRNRALLVALGIDDDGGNSDAGPGCTFWSGGQEQAGQDEPAKSTPGKTKPRKRKPRTMTGLKGGQDERG